MPNASQRTGANHPAYDYQLRTFSVRNMAKEDVPGYAIMQLRDRRDSSGQRDYFFNCEVKEREIVWLVQKPDEEGCALSGYWPGLFVINASSTPIPKNGGYGRATFEFPCQVLHDGRSDGAPNGTLCGPVPDKWWILSTGYGFRVKSHDITAAADKGGIHTVWIEPSSSPMADRHRGGGGGSVESRQPLQLSADSTEGIESIGNAVKVRLPARYLFGFSATVQADSSAEQGAELTLRLYHAETGDSPGATLAPRPTMFVGSRANQVEIDNYGNKVHWSAENVAFSGWIDAKAGDRLSIVNESSVKISVYNVVFWMHALGERKRTEDRGGLVYP